MTSQTNEQALESAIEKALTGTTLEALKAQGIQNIAEDPQHYRAGNRYWIGTPTSFNKEYAIDEVRLWHFLEETQLEELEKLKGQSSWKLSVIQRLDRMIKKQGVMHVLRRGLDIGDAHLTLLYPYPLASSSLEVKSLFEKNEFSVTRQVTYSNLNPREEIDMVIFINGLPIMTIELKNPWTGQTAKYHGIKQYKSDRDPNQPLLQFGRCVVHMTVDTDEIYMTTKLKGNSTYFLPFNKGNNNGAGNPPNPFGHKTSYLWEEILTRPSVSNILQHFVRLDGKSTDALDTRTLFFPRYHQLQVVRKILKHVSENGLGQTYLMQHSAGSGKSNSITWAAYQLIESYPVNGQFPGARGIDNPLFDSVIVVTDRTILDKQLSSNIKEFSQVKNIVSHAFKSKDLKEAMEAGKRIIITTIQKFPVIVDDIADMSDKRFAVIIDEAHSSQSGTAHDKMNRSLGAQKDEDEYRDVQEMILESMRTRKMKGNASYFAFTATPKRITLEKFGVQDEEGRYVPFDLYSMKQAIEEGFILDVLANYTTYRSYYEIHKSIEDNPLFDSLKAQKKLKAYVEKHPETIATKAEIMMDHFIKNVVNKKKLKGKAKGMALTQSIESAIKYYLAIKRILADRGMPFKAIVAFTGKKEMGGFDYTEENINNLPAHLDTAKPSDPDYISDKIARYFDMDEYRILVVANKFLTGFDQPKLSTMYIDKKLQDVMAVQALSRLNRAAPKYGKKTEDLFILDFFNQIEDIKKSFDPFYTSTTLSGATDLNVLHEIKDTLDDVGVYEWHEVEQFNELFFKGEDAQKLSVIIAIAEQRFSHELELTDNDKADFKIKAKQFVKIYGQMASIMAYEVVRWEMLFWYLKFLVPKLVVKNKDDDKLDELLSSIDLSTYALERTRLSYSIGLDSSDTELDPQNPNPRGAYDDEPEVDELDLIIKSFNERWFQGWEATPEEQRVKFVNFASEMKKHKDYESKYANNPDQQNRQIALEKIFDQVARKQRKNDMALYRLLAQDDAFKQAMLDTMKRMLG